MEALTGGEHSALGFLRGRKGEKSDGRGHVIVNRFHATTDEICFVPEAGAGRFAEKIFPPGAMKAGARPILERRKIAPVLAHSHVEREKRKEHIFMKQQP